MTATVISNDDFNALSNSIYGIITKIWEAKYDAAYPQHTIPFGGSEARRSIRQIAEEDAYAILFDLEQREKVSIRITLPRP